MKRVKGVTWLTALAALTTAAVSDAGAAEVRFHYAPVDAAGNTTLKPSGPGNAIGEKRTWVGSVRRPYVNQPRPTHLVTFLHPYTGQHVTVPLTLPEGTPRLEYRPDRVVYNYGSYTVEAQFLRDGSVDVVYNSGLLRGI